MPRRRRVTVPAAAALALFLLGAPQVVRADGVGDAQKQVDAMLNQLDDLQNQMGQLDEDYGMAEDRRTHLQAEISVAQVKIDALTGQVGAVQTVLTQIAVDRFTSGDTVGLSPLFADVSSYTDGQQKAALGMAAIDAGQTDMDSLQKLSDDLAGQQRAMQRKTDEAAQLMHTLDDKRAAYDKLEATYTKLYAKAQRDLGAAKLKAEQERREAAAAAALARANAAKAAAAKAAASKAAAAHAVSAPRGGGSGGTSSSGSTTVKVVAPSGGSTASGKGAIAVNAALGQLGVPYKFATSSPGVSFDCSGLTAWAWAQAGVSLPHVSRMQYSSLPHVNISDARPGDLVFYYTPISHVGLYIGNGQMVHAPQTGSVVSITTVRWEKVVGVARPG